MVGRGPYKRQSLKILVERQIPIATVIDIGVLSGTPELMETFPNKRHILFEPVSDFHKQIRKKYAGLDYRLIEAAVTDEDGDVTLHVAKFASQTEITHSWVTDAAPQSSEPRIVPSTRLDTFTKANALVKPYLVKIDVDGNEMRILSGATETLKDASVVIIETPKDEFSERIAFLEKQGFVLFDLAAPCYYDDSFWQCDAIFIRSELQRRHFKQLDEVFETSAYVEFNENSIRHQFHGWFRRGRR